MEIEEAAGLTWVQPAGPLRKGRAVDPVAVHAAVDSVPGVWTFNMFNNVPGLRRRYDGH